MQNIQSVEHTFTVSDVLAIDDDRRYELIDGQIICMASPSEPHQAIVGELFAQIHASLRGKACRVRISPYSVMLSQYNYVQPDVFVICDHSKITRQGCVGAPDFIIEVISHGNATNDTIKKLNLYQDSGVREYWMVLPDDRKIQVCTLINGHYIFKLHNVSEKTLQVTVLDDCLIDLDAVFAAGDEFANIGMTDKEDSGE